MTVLRWLLGAVVVLALAVAGVALGARFADGPVALFPGGALRSGEWAADWPMDWSFAAEIPEIELESEGRSRTTWILVDGGAAYVPCSLDFPPGKTWHHAALERPDAVVRVEGRRYRTRLVRSDDEALRSRLGAAVQRKYTGGPAGDASRVWFFRLNPRPAAGG